MELDRASNTKLTTELREAEVMINNLKDEMQFSKDIVEKYTDKVARSELETSETRDKVIKTEELLQSKQEAVEEAQLKVVRLIFHL